MTEIMTASQSQRGDGWKAALQPWSKRGSLGQRSALGFAGGGALGRASRGYILMHDLVISDAVIVDGLGGMPYRADLAVAGGRIAAIGADLGAARRTVDG